nr:MAG TPA: hypothetical protein [Caudoviricetes sp.]
MVRRLQRDEPAKYQTDASTGKYSTFPRRSQLKVS